MKQCPKCHAENPMDAKFCRKCRYNFSGSAPEIYKLIKLITPKT